MAGHDRSAAVTDDWFEFLVALLTARARFLVVGAHALAAHGVPRATQDIDMWVRGIVAAMASFWAVNALYQLFIPFPLPGSPFALRFALVGFAVVTASAYLIAHRTLGQSSPGQQ